ncbi:uncharacterized protein CMU_027550 [Cryptosporidium muris RN66]|uniref:Uncharacterized protein n=1 Tax=Cryptosporidium muris (strain RN66) TaxID=441375 RepID=B6ABJ3_CRYMR|nr:uncharacterized protein CMU_027550 [Cryptosporidium muris RN66]EEA05745.1 hypothetical protein CMU_027550 [Cryptosporidium muris RN66]|eukprot:XP_002140094.1 hypothetical protein [Cryptosporidium muris RN66]
MDYITKSTQYVNNGIYKQFICRYKYSTFIRNYSGNPNSFSKKLSFNIIQQRFLGNKVSGPAASYNVIKHLKIISRLNPSLTYTEFKQRCESLRIFIYFGMCIYLTGELVNNPLKSSYWYRYTPINFFKYVLPNYMYPIDKKY